MATNEENFRKLWKAIANKKIWTEDELFSTLDVKIELAKKLIFTKEEIEFDSGSVGACPACKEAFIRTYGKCPLDWEDLFGVSCCSECPLDWRTDDTDDTQSKEFVACEQVGTLYNQFGNASCILTAIKLRKIAKQISEMEWK